MGWTNTESLSPRCFHVSLPKFHQTPLHIHSVRQCFSERIIAIAGALWLSGDDSLVLLACSLGAILLVLVYRLDYLHPAVAYALPWFTVLLFSIIPISTHARKLDATTYQVLLLTIFSWLVMTIGASVGKYRSERIAGPRRDYNVQGELKKEYLAGICFGFLTLYAFAAANVAFAGYLPLVSLVTTGDSGYKDFGIHSIYGAFLAYANALGCLSFYVYARSRRPIFLLLFLSVVGIHLAFVTRQNVATLLLEAFVIWCFTRGRVSGATMATLIVLGLASFTALGELRSGSIKDIISVDQRFLWIPTSVDWLYAYSYFNVLISTT